MKSFHRLGSSGGSAVRARGICSVGALTQNGSGDPVRARRTGDRMNGIPGMFGVKVVTGAAAAVLLMAYMGPTPALADTIEAALVRAYQNNPQLNAQRAQVRSTDENVPQALSGYRPKVALTASAGYQYTDTLSSQGGSPTAARANRHPWRQCAAQRRPDGHADAVQRQCRPPTRPAPPRARFPARARRCA